MLNLFLSGYFPRMIKEVIAKNFKLKKVINL